MSTVFADHLLADTHANRPAANTVPAGTLFACSDHTKVYQSDGSSWSDWHDGSGGASFSGASLTKSANQTGLTSGVTSLITFNGTDYDTDSYFSDANDSLVIPSNGFYRVTATVTLSMTSAADWAVIVFVDDSEAAMLGRQDPTSPDTVGPNATINGSRTLSLTAAEEVDLRVFVSGTAVDVVATRTFLQIERLG